MERISFSSILNTYRIYDRQFWLEYKTLQKVMNPLRFDEIKMSLLRSKRIDEKYLSEIDIDEYNTELQLLDDEWTNKNEEAKQAGILIHEKIRNLFCTDLSSVKNDLGIDIDSYKPAAQEYFLNTEKGIFNELKLEYQLSDDVVLVGIIDCLIKDGNNIKIIDFKSNEKIKKDSHYDFALKKKKTLKYPLQKIADCSFSHYQLQLSIYAWLVQKLNPDFIIDSLEIWQMDNLKVKNKLPVEYIKKDIDKLMEWEVNRIRIDNEMNKCNLIQY